MATTKTIQVAAGNCDANENTYGVTTPSMQYVILGKSSSITWLGLRFTGADISGLNVDGVPVTITRARLQFRVSSNKTTAGGNVQFGVEDSATPAVFAATTPPPGNISGRVRYTGTGVNMGFTATAADGDGVWPDPNEIGATVANLWYWLEPSGFIDLIQHCANQTGLTSIALLIQHTTSTGAFRNLRSYEAPTAGTNCAKLEITYESEGPPQTATVPVASAIGAALVPTADAPVTVTVPVASAVGYIPVPTVSAPVTTTVPVATAIGKALVPTVVSPVTAIVPVAKAIGVALVPTATSTGSNQITTIPVARAVAVTPVPTTVQGVATPTVPVARAIGKALVPTVVSPVSVTVPVATAKAVALMPLAQPGAITATVPVARAIARALVPIVTGLASFQRHTLAVNWIDKTAYPTGTKFYLQVRFKTNNAGFPITARLMNETGGDTIVGGPAADVTSASTTMTTMRGSVDLGPYLADPSHVYYVNYGGPVGGTYTCELSEVYHTSG